MDRRFPELFSDPGTARLLRRLGLRMGSRSCPFRGYCLLSLPRLSGSDRTTLAVTIRSTSASGSSKPSLYLPSAGMLGKQPLFLHFFHLYTPRPRTRVVESDLLISVGCETWVLAPITCLHTSSIFISCICIMTFSFLSSLVSICVGCSWSAKEIGGDKAEDGREMKPLCRNHLSRDLDFLKS